jgi:hypothetical protein
LDNKPEKTLCKLVGIALKVIGEPLDPIVCEGDTVNTFVFMTAVT